MSVEISPIDGVRFIAHSEKEDQRGMFKYIFQTSELVPGEYSENPASDFLVTQVNHSLSEANVLRGIHVEPWSKLAYVVSGLARIVVVDLRVGSTTYGKWIARDVGDFAGGRVAVVIPEGCGNGFYTFAPTHYLNFVSREFSAEGRMGVKWDDPRLDIDWGNSNDPILSDVDAHQMSLDSFELNRETSDSV